jgi:hypothetical protein
MPDYIAPPTTLSPGSLIWGYLRDSGGDAQEKEDILGVKNFLTRFVSKIDVDYKTPICITPTRSMI